jgi:hypothetical protein
VQGVAAGGVSIVGEVGSYYADSIWSRARANAYQNAVVRAGVGEEVNPLYDNFWLGPDHASLVPDAAASPPSDDDDDDTEDFDISAFINDDDNDDNDENTDTDGKNIGGSGRGKKHRLTRRLSRKYNHIKKKSKMTKRKVTKYSKKKKYKQNKL